MREEKKREILLSMFDGVHSTSELVDQAYQYGVEQWREEAINTVENHIEMLGTWVSINVTLRLREMQWKERKKEMLEDLSTPTTDE
jgi:hypothetical protein